MDLTDLTAALDAGETYTVEFKGERREPLSDSKLVEVVVCLANGAGGTLLIGVEDDGTVTGAEPRHGTHTDTLRLQAMVANSTTPPVSVEAVVVEHEDGPVVVVTVPDEARVVGTTKGLYQRRALGGDGRPACIAFPAHEMLAREIDRGAVDYATLPVRGATWDDLDPLELERVRRLVREGGPAADPVLASLADTEIAKALGVAVDVDGATVPLAGALLLFGRTEALERMVPTHEVAFQVLRGDAVEVNEIARWPLLRAADELFSRLRARSTEEEVDAGLVRIALPSLPEVVVREVVANALVHRDWTRLGAIQVQLTEDALEIASPGGLPIGVRVDNILREQNARSPRLAEAFKRVGLVERTGRGVNRMFSTLLRIGREQPDYGLTTDESVRAVIPVAGADRALARYIIERETRLQRPTPLSQLLVLHALRHGGRQRTRDLALVLQQTDAQARAVLADLVVDGQVEARGDGPGRTHHLSAAVYRVLDPPAAHTRVRGFDRLQQEQMVLGYVNAQGRITRGQTAELCAVSPTQAGYLLRQMVGNGLLALHGDRRWAYYDRG